MHVNLTIINNSHFAILVWFIQEGKEDKAKVYSGMATWNADTASVEIYRDDSGKPALVLTGELLERIQIVAENVKEILLGADYFIPLTLRDLPGGDTTGFNQVGLNW